MKNFLFLPLFILLSTANLYAQNSEQKDASLNEVNVNIDTDFIKNSSQTLEKKLSFSYKIESFDMKKVNNAESFKKRKNKAKHKSKFGSFFLNFAEHNFNTFTC